ncbi:hypothetical protein V6N13_047558 [Hibiscus sabdariffa]|uniref:FAD dependent oxidoreductase domain-containing protein n=1 Tax=Hibiscus sabdariffa TaxID=183260 RepID=A0ABR2F4J8_9ROSI
MRVAVVGGGISGVVSAYVLAKQGANVVVYEKQDDLVGPVRFDGADLDLAFMVFNSVSFPLPSPVIDHDAFSDATLTVSSLDV